MAILLLLTGGLWLCWPKSGYQAAAGDRRLPEPAASYVEVAFVGDLAGHHARSFGGQRNLGALTRQPMALLSPSPKIPIAASPDYATLPMPALERPEPLEVIEPQLPGLVPGSGAAEPARIAATSGLVVRVSQGLRQAGYEIEGRATIPTNAPSGRALFQITLDQSGKVVGLLDESPNASGIYFRRLLLSTAGTNAASGEIKVEW